MNRKYIAKIITLAGLLSFSSIGWAGCTVAEGTYNYSSTMPTQPLSVPRDKAPGTPIGSVMSVAAGTGRIVTCSGGPTWTYLKFGTPLTLSSIPGVYKTNVEGIGIKVWDDFSGTVVVENGIKAWYQPEGGASDSYTGNAWLISLKAQYYIIGPVATGAVVPEISVEAWANTAATTVNGGLYNKLTIGGSTAINALACETPDISVNLKKQDGDALRTIGATAPTTPFTFRMNDCGPDMASVSYTFKPAPGVSLEGSGADQYLTLDSSSTASGVGIQMLYENETNVPFNTKTQFTDYTGAGSYTIPMKARFIRTGKITGGSARTVVEFEMLYE